MGESPRLRTVERAFERWNAGDRTPPWDDVHPEIEVLTEIARAFKGEPFRGYAGLGEWLAALDENFERWEIDLDEIHERGDVIVALGMAHTRGRGSGVELEVPVGMVIEFRESKVTRLTVFPDRDEALATGGLS